MTRTTLALVVALGCGCADQTARTPAPASVAPSRGADAVPIAVTISGDGFDPQVFADYRKASGSRVDVAFQAQLETESGTAVPLEDLQWVDSRTLTAVVPASTPRGSYDLVVRDPAGRTGRLAAAFSVVSSAESVSGFLFDAIGPQKIGIPFLVNVAAVDQESSTVDGFDGMATITASEGMPAALSFGPFVRGRFRSFVTLSALGSGIRLTAEDGAGNRGTSDAFEVGAGSPAVVVFAVSPATSLAGGCSGPFELETRDLLGLPALDSAARAIALTANPAEAVAFFADPACQAPRANVTIEADTSRTSFHAVSVRSGTIALRATPVGLPSAVRALEVSPAAPSQLVFVTPGAAVKAGECSAPVEIEAEDTYGNPASLPAAVPLEVSVAPLTGVTLHPDTTCSSLLGALELPAGQSRARFRFRSNAPMPVTLRVRAADGGTFAAVEQIVEVVP